MSLINGSNFSTATVEDDSSQYMLDGMLLLFLIFRRVGVQFLHRFY